MTGKRKSAPKKSAPKVATAREPKTAPRDAAETAAFEQGRAARRSSIDKRASPQSKGRLRDAWVEGWEYQDDIS